MHELTRKLTGLVTKCPYLSDKYKALVGSIEAMKRLVPALAAPWVPTQTTRTEIT